MNFLVEWTSDSGDGNSVKMNTLSHNACLLVRMRYPAWAWALSTIQIIPASHKMGFTFKSFHYYNASNRYACVSMCYALCMWVLARTRKNNMRAVCSNGFFFLCLSRCTLAFHLFILTKNVCYCGFAVRITATIFYYFHYDMLLSLISLSLLIHYGFLSQKWILVAHRYRRRILSKNTENKFYISIFDAFKMTEMGMRNSNDRFGEVFFVRPNNNKIDVGRHAHRKMKERYKPQTKHDRHRLICIIFFLSIWN